MSPILREAAFSEHPSSKSTLITIGMGGSQHLAGRASKAAGSSPGVCFGLVVIMLYFDLSMRNLDLHALQISIHDSASHWRGE